MNSLVKWPFDIKTFRGFPKFTYVWSYLEIYLLCCVVTYYPPHPLEYLVGRKIFGHFSTTDSRTVFISDIPDTLFSGFLVAPRSSFVHSKSTPSSTASGLMFSHEFPKKMTVSSIIRKWNHFISSPRSASLKSDFLSNALNKRKYNQNKNRNNHVS